MNSGARCEWIQMAVKLAEPVLGALDQRQLKATMPVEAAPGVTDRPDYTYLEALARLLCGLAPWLELGEDDTEEDRLRGRLAKLARSAIDAATDPNSPDFMNFSQGRQPLVDAAFLAQAMVRAPRELWEKLEPRVQANVLTALQATRPIPPGDSNWRLFATMVEVWLHRAGGGCDEERLLAGIRKHQAWYVGDGIYGDGPEFHWDYYNSYVIQPMLVEGLDWVGEQWDEWKAFQSAARKHLTRWATVQERLVAPDGSFPVIGRSIAYRCAAFQGLAMAAWRHMLPPEMKPAQARAALTAVIRRSLGAEGTFDAQGWLRIGLSGHQPALGENYISTGSLYLCSTALLPLGLPADDPFWRDPAVATTWQQAWSGKAIPADHALKPQL